MVNYNLSATVNHVTHYYQCKCCNGKSLDSDIRALAGCKTLEPKHVSHDTNCPGKSFPDKYVRRIERMF